MKNLIIFCAAIIIAATSSAYATPILEFDNNLDEQVILYDIEPLEFTRYNDTAKISEDLNLNLGTLTEGDDFSDLTFASSWTPIWYDDFNWDWWLEFFDWWTTVFPPGSIIIICPLPGDNPSPVPEPATMLLFGTGLVGLAIIARREKK